MMKNKHEYEDERVDKFLRKACFEVEDNGFSERVLQTLPKRVGWERRLQHIWQLVCLSAVLLIGWSNHVLDIIAIDLSTLIHTLPLNYSIFELIALPGLMMLVFCLLALNWGRKVIY